MTITEYKILVAAIPDDLMVGEKIEVSRDGKVWHAAIFWKFCDPDNDSALIHTQWVTNQGDVFYYARRPAATQKKRLRDELWTDDDVFKFRAVDKNGNAHYYEYEPEIVYEYDGHRERIGGGYDSTDWQNSLENKPE